MDDIFFGLIASGSGGVREPGEVVLTYLINEQFEGTGLPSGWTDAFGGPSDPDYATNPLKEFQSIRIVSATTTTRSPTFTGQTTAYAHCRLRYDLFSGAAHDVFYLHDGSTILASMYMDAGTVYLNAGGSNSSASPTTLSSGVTYYVWLTFVSGGTCELAISSTTTKPTSAGAGVVYLTKTGATGTASAIDLVGYSTDDIRWDNVLVSASPIGDNP